MNTSRKIRNALIEDERGFGDLEFAWPAGGMIRGALNEGKSTPINIQVTGKNMAKAAAVASAIRDRVAKVDGVVDARVVQRLNYPEFVVNVDRTKAADLGMTQEDVMQGVNAGAELLDHLQQEEPLDRSVQLTTSDVRRRAIPEKDIKSLETLLDIPHLRAASREPWTVPCGPSPTDHAGRPSRPDLSRYTSSRPSTSRWASRAATSATSPRTSPGSSTISARSTASRRRSSPTARSRGSIRSPSGTWVDGDLDSSTRSG